jgi:nucleoside recognition membrane protein YjiH
VNPANQFNFNDIFKSNFLDQVTSFSALDMAIALGLAFVGRGAGLRAGVHPVIRQVLRNRVSKNPTNSFFKIITPFPH